VNADDAAAAVTAAINAMHEAALAHLPAGAEGHVMVLASLDTTDMGPSASETLVWPADAARAPLTDEQRRQAAVYTLAWHLHHLGDEDAERLVADALAQVRRHERPRTGSLRRRPPRPRPRGA